MKRYLHHFVILSILFCCFPMLTGCSSQNSTESIYNDPRAGLTDANSRTKNVTGTGFRYDTEATEPVNRNTFYIPEETESTEPSQYICDDPWDFTEIIHEEDTPVIPEATVPPSTQTSDTPTVTPEKPTDPTEASTTAPDVPTDVPDDTPEIVLPEIPKATEVEPIKPKQFDTATDIPVTQLIPNNTSDSFADFEDLVLWTGKIRRSIYA